MCNTAKPTAPPLPAALGATPATTTDTTMTRKAEVAAAIAARAPSPLRTVVDAPANGRLGATLPMLFTPFALPGAGAAGLRKVRAEEIHDSSPPLVKTSLDLENDAQEVAAYQHSVLDVNIEQWYGLIEEHTFATEFLPFSADVAQLFVAAYLDYEGYLKAQAGGAAAAEPYTPPAGLQRRVDALAATLQPVIDRVRGTTSSATPVFVKASSRSAKDAPTSQQKLADVYRARLQAHGGDRTDNTKLTCMLEAGLEVMKAYTARDTLDLFMRSERIYQDMLLALEATASPLGNHAWNVNFAVRAWVDIDVDMEFRGFVKGGELTALSQYNHLIHSPRLVGRSAAIERRVREFFAAELKASLDPAHKDYVIDFALTAPGRGCGDDEKIWVIELNPFLETTDGCLFSWKRDSDVLNGHAPFEMRVCAAARNGAKALIASDWRKLFECEGVGFDTADTYRG